MSLIASNSGGEFELAPSGAHIARCYRVIDLGTQLDKLYGKRKHKVNIGWELPNTKMESGEPYAVWGFYNVNLHPESSLGALLVAWRGREFSKDEQAHFDLTKILGAPCWLNIVHAENHQGKMRAKVAAIMPLPSGIECPPAINAPLLFDISNWDQAVFDQLSETLQNMINESAEVKARQPSHAAPPQSTVNLQAELYRQASASASEPQPMPKAPAIGMNSVGDPDDDIPW